MSADTTSRAKPVIHPDDAYVDFAAFAKSLGFQPRHLTQLRHDHAETFPPHIQRHTRTYVRLGPLKAWLATMEQESPGANASSPAHASSPGTRQSRTQ